MPISLLTSGSNIVTSSDFSSVISAIQSQISVSTVVEVLAVVVGLGVGFAFMWWGVRKGIGALMKGFKKGKIDV